MKYYHDPLADTLDYMPGYNANSPLTATEKLMTEGLKKKPLTEAELGVKQNRTNKQLASLNKFGQNRFV